MPGSSQSKRLVDIDSGELFLPWRKSGAGPGPETLLVAVGDVMLDRQVGVWIRERGPEHPFLPVLSLLRQGDLVFGNLENPISSDRSSPLPGKRINFCAVPEAADGLARAGFKVMTMANNHMMDYGPAAMRETMHLLAQRGIRHVGAGANLGEAREPAICEVRGLRVAFLGYNSPDQEVEATDARPGLAPARLDLVLEDIREAKRKADVVAVSLHRGLEFSPYPLPDQQHECRRMVEAGADLILGHHPHDPQGVELWRGGLIFHSLGHFVLDWEPPVSRWEKERFRRSRDWGLLVQVWLTRHGVSRARVLPIRQNGSCQAELLEGPAKQQALRGLRHLSWPLNQERLNRIVWRHGGEWLRFQFDSHRFHWRNGLSRRRWLRSFARWGTSDLVVRMLWGRLTGAELPDWALSLKNSLLGRAAAAARGLGL